MTVNEYRFRQYITSIVMKIIALQLFVVLVALHTSDEAKPKKEKPKTVCDYEERYLFCDYMKLAYTYNEDAIYELEDQEVEPELFTEDIRKLGATNSEIEKLLKLTVDGAKPKGKQRKNACDIDALFCVYVDLADYNNERAIGDLMDPLVEGDSFKESLKRLLDTNRDVKKLLKLEAEKKSELIQASRLPLEKEVSALFGLRVTCSDGRRKLIVCNETLDGVYLATYYMIQAIEEVAEGKQLEAIKEAHEKFTPKFLSPPENETIYEIVTVFANAVLRILDTYGSF
ncbi:unnamed protein product [Nippostrongylus brasiliensis]|uniref:Uncharacterized protein n=1 Tax=Nippostrongylus brasiliensis TaxID=27835 RepID=A0A0N4YB57_NIPBR|nr:unnamed protein product [Nippostrongylus brasiliensis]